jgi:hypothetical protein
MHLPAYAVIGRFADLRASVDKSTLIVMTASIFLAWALMLSQAIESATRVFYARADLDLIMSSPVALANAFSVRIAAVALSVIAMALLLSTPFIDVLVIGGGLRWLAAYGVVVAIGLSAAAVAIAVTIVLFRTIGPSRTRLVAQILAAIVGAEMAAGQLAGGLAWLTISGEDAADLVATAPLPPSRVIRAKIEVVLIVIGVIFAPLIVALIFASPLQAVVTASGVAIAAASATAIQLWFRVQAQRSQFRRRQTSSRLATFAEAFSSIGWAATAALAVSIPVIALVSGLTTAGILAATWKISPRQE